MSSIPDATSSPVPQGTAEHDAEAPAAPPSLVTAGVLAAWLGLGWPEDVPPVPADPAFARPGAPAPDRLVILDVRFRSAEQAADHEGYLHGHVPGAVYVSLPSQLAGHAAPSEGRHPLPDPRAFQETVRMCGIEDGDTVVVYDDDASLSAARAWWLLRHAGVTDSLVLDGGLQAWREAGLPLQPGEVIPVPGSAHISWGRMPVVDADGAAALAEIGLLLDARAPERYRGEVEPIDAVAGHIPGARSLPARELTAADGRLLPAAEIATHMARLEPDAEAPAAIYCGSGVTASLGVLALAVAGRPGVALYPGSWSAWTQDPERPVARGAEPGALDPIGLQTRGR